MPISHIMSSRMGIIATFAVQLLPLAENRLPLVMRPRVALHDVVYEVLEHRDLRAVCTEDRNVPGHLLLLR